MPRSNVLLPRTTAGLTFLPRQQIAVDQHPLLDLIANVGSVFVIWYGGLAVIHGTLTLGELVAFSTYLGQLLQPVRRVGMVIPAISLAATAGERIFEVDTPRR
ncbi:MAG: hypothetical protein U0175_22035 [Caldilineaceae bacterium]